MENSEVTMTLSDAKSNFVKAKNCVIEATVIAKKI